MCYRKLLYSHVLCCSAYQCQKVFMLTGESAPVCYCACVYLHWSWWNNSLKYFILVVNHLHTVKILLKFKIIPISLLMKIPHIYIGLCDCQGSYMILTWDWNVLTCVWVQVDGVDIQGYTNQQAVEVLRHTGQTVNLKLVRRGFKPEDACPSIPVAMETTPTPSASRNSTMERSNTMHGNTRTITAVLLNESVLINLLTSVAHVCLNTPYMYLKVFLQFSTNWIYCHAKPRHIKA